MPSSMVFPASRARTAISAARSRSSRSAARRSAAARLATGVSRQAGKASAARPTSVATPSGFSAATAGASGAAHILDTKASSARRSPKVRPLELRRLPNRSAARAIFECRGASQLARGPLQKLGDRHALVPHPRHEGRVRAVLQEPTHQVGQEVAVPADGRVDPAGDVLGLAHRLVERLAHPVQALELEARPVAGGVGHLQHGRHGQRVVGGDLREQDVAALQHPARAGQEGHVGRGLAREDGEVVLPLDLGVLDLRVPVGALDKPHHHPAALRCGLVGDPVDHRQSPALHRPAPPARTRPNRAGRRRRRPRRSRRATAPAAPAPPRRR